MGIEEYINTEDEQYIFKQKEAFRKRVLDWVFSLQITQTQFRMIVGGAQSIYTSCFALFIMCLLRKDHTFLDRERDSWVSYINSFQDETTGYYVPAYFEGDFHSKEVHQLTCFCLSALHLLGAKPLYPFTFVERWLEAESVGLYLKNMGCLRGKPMSGNMAMFFAVFLTYQYEACKDLSAVDHLNDWFQSHNKAQNPQTGFWGTAQRMKYYEGFQIAFHQLLVYHYWGKPVPYSTMIVDRILSLQSPDGFFAPYPGGGGCWDYDAADILINCGYYRGYKQNEIAEALMKLLVAILGSQNADGGFGETQKRPKTFGDVFSGDNRSFICSGRNPYVWYYRLRTTAGIARSSRNRIYTHWTGDGRMWHESDMWDTWIRCLTIAEIDTVLSATQRIDKTGWKFHHSIGIGYFRGK